MFIISTKMRTIYFMLLSRYTSKISQVVELIWSQNVQKNKWNKTVIQALKKSLQMPVEWENYPYWFEEIPGEEIEIS